MAVLMAGVAAPTTGRAAVPAVLAAVGPLAAKAGATKAGGAASAGTTGAAGIDPGKVAEAIEKRQERLEKQWDHMMKLNKDVKELIDLWKPEPAAIKAQLDHLEAAEKALGSPTPPVRNRTRLDGTALFTQPTSSLPPLSVAMKESKNSTPVPAAPTAGTRLRAGAARPPVLLPTTSSKPHAQSGERCCPEARRSGRKLDLRLQ
jgi:hypothetical protein